MVLVLPAAAAAQAPLTLDAALQAALARNPAVAAARAQVDRASAEVDAARGHWFPRLTLSEGVQRGDQPVFAFGALLAARQFTAADFAVTRLNQPGATNLFTTRATVSQLVFDGGRTPGAQAEAVARRDLAQADADAAALEILLNVSRTYGGLISLQASARAVDAAIDAAAEDLRRAERRRDAGTVTDADVLAVSVHLSDLRQRRLQLDADRAAAAAQLNRLMGNAIDAPVEPAGLAPVTSADLGNLASLFAEAEAARPDLRRADAHVRLADAAGRQARSVWWPTVAAQAGVEWNGVTFGDRARAWVVGGELRWSLSLSSADRARIAAARAARTAATLARDDVRAAVQVDVLTVVRRLEAARARVTVGAEAMAEAGERARVVRNRYDAGLASMTDVLAAAGASLDAEARHVAAQVDVMIAGAELQRALGRQVWK